jgi:hypothetical protein
VIRADVTIAYDDAVARTGPRIREVGDLEGAIALDTVDARGLFLHPGRESLVVGRRQSSLIIGAPARIEIRRAANPRSQLVLRIEPR